MIRKARLEDVNRLADIGEYRFNHSDYSRYDFNRQDTEAELASIITMMEEGGFPTFKPFLYVCEEDGIILGGIIFNVYKNWFSNDFVSDMTLIIIDKGHTKGMTGIKLLKTFKEVSFKEGAMEVRVGDSSNIKRDKLRRVYERLGFTASMTTFRCSKQESA